MSNRVLTCAGVIQRENGTRASGIGQDDAGLLGDLTDRRRPQGLLPLALVAVDGAAGEHPGPAHEPGGRVALDEQQLEGVWAPPRSRITVAASRGAVSAPVFSSSPGPGWSISTLCDPTARRPPPARPTTLPPR